MCYRETKIAEYIVDETQFKVGSEYIWLWVAIEPETKNIIAINISKERNMFVSRETFYLRLSMNMVNIQFQRMAEHGIRKRAGF